MSKSLHRLNAGICRISISSISSISSICRICCCLLLAACHNRTAPAAAPEKHLVLLTRPGAALFVDKVDNRVVLQQARSSQNSFCSFRIGWTDSATAAGKLQSTEKERYFQYTVQQDWKALAGGDTLLPVFFLEKPSLSEQLKEGVIVFETPEGRQPDTLIYRDSFGPWGTQVFVLNRK